MAERWIFVFSAIAAFGLFAYSLGQRLRPLATARNDLRWDNWGARWKRLFGEVVLQRRVLSGRPVAGLLHAIVFWGFLVFAWISAEHLWLGFVGFGHARGAPTWYDHLAGGWAIAVLAGMVGLSVRRFALRPKALGGVSASSGLVAALILLLMTTYLAQWLWLDVESAAWKANWWLHTYAFLGLLVVIPGSKHLHLALAPLAIFFRDGEVTSATRALREEDDNDFGMVRFSDLSRKDALDVNACVECGRCSDACPAHAVGGSLDPKRIILQMQRGLRSNGAADARVAGSQEEAASGAAWVAEEDLFQCLTCGACEQVCPVGIEHVGKKIVDLRRGLVSEGRTHLPKLTDLFNTMERSPHNPWGAPQQSRRKLIENERFPIFDGSQEWLFWLGCGLSYDPHGNDVARAMQRIFDTAGVSWGVLEQESCCGEPARRAGNEYLFMELSEATIDRFAAKRVKKIVTCDPHCCRMFDSDFRQNSRFAELGVRVLHHTELLRQLAPKLPFQREEEPLAYHDPCYLSRGRGVTEQPREVLELIGAEITEMRRSRKQSFCCGAGGAQLFLADDRAERGSGRVNQERFDEIVATGADTVAVSCPYCPIMLKDAANRSDRPDLRILDVAELVAARL